MKLPLIVCQRGALTARFDYFERIGKLNIDTGTLDINVLASGVAEFHWILDSEGKFFELVSKGVLRATLFQRIGLFRRRERFAIVPSRSITAGEVGDRMANLRELSEEAPYLFYMKQLIESLPRGRVLTPEDLRKYFGQEAP